MNTMNQHRNAGLLIALAVTAVAAVTLAAQVAVKKPVTSVAGSGGVVVTGKIGTASVTTAKVADAAVTADKLAAAIAGAGLTGGAGTALSVVVDDSTVEVNTDTLRVKNGGITKLKLAGGFLKVVAIAGAAAGDLTATGIASGDELVAVIPLDLVAGFEANLLAEFTITATNTINNAAGTSTAGKTLLVIWLDLT